MRRLVWAATLVSVLTMSAAVVLAKGPPGKVTISGPGIDELLEVVDDAWMEPLSLPGFMDIFHEVEAPVSVGAGYLLTRYGFDGEQHIAFDEVVYYPATTANRALVYYSGIVNGGSEYDGRWFPVTEAGEAAMQAILGGNPGVETEAASPQDIGVLIRDLLSMLVPN